MVCDYRPLKTEKHCIQLTVGGDKLDYIDDTASPAVSLIKIKMLINSVISDSAKEANFFTMDIKDFLLQTTMSERDLIIIHSQYISNHIQNQYNLDRKSVV